MRIGRAMAGLKKDLLAFFVNVQKNHWVAVVIDPAFQQIWWGIH
jgi:hypothetical protein